MTDQSFPVSNGNMDKAHLRAWMQYAGAGDYIVSGCAMSAGAGLTLNIAAGLAVMQGVFINFAAKTAAMTASATNHVFLTIDENNLDTIVITVNTTGTAPTTPYIKLGTVVTGVSSITTVTNVFTLTPSNVYGPYTRAIGRRASAWVSERQVVWRTVSIGASTTFTNQGSFWRMTSTATNGWVADSLAGELTLRNSTGADWAAGDVLAFVCKLILTGVPSAANNLHGFEFIDSPTLNGTKNATTPRRLAFGVASDSHLYFVTCDGTSVTATDLGTYTSGAELKVQVVFTKGTNVVVTINDGTPTTISSTLPTRVSNLFAGLLVATSTGQIDWYDGAAYKLINA